MGLLTRGKEYLLPDIDVFSRAGYRLQSIIHDPDNPDASTIFQNGDVNLKITPTEYGGQVVRNPDDTDSIFRFGGLNHDHQSPIQAFNLLYPNRTLAIYNGSKLIATLRARDYGVNPPPNL